MSNDLYEEGAESRYTEILNDFKNLAITRFKWNNLPLGLTSERLETMLMTRGQVFAFKRKEGTLTILPCTGTNQINIYSEFTAYNVIGDGGFTQTVNAEDGVRIKNNPVASGNLSNLEIFAQRVDNTERTQDVNLFQQNIPRVILSDENGKLTAKKLLEHMKKFKFAIFGKKSLPTQVNSTEVLDTTAPYLLDKLQDHKNNLINEVLTSLGINNFNSDKKERLVVDEVNANNDLISIMIDLMYDLRVEGCKLINEKFKPDKPLSVEKREVNINGSQHNDTGEDNK